MNDAIIRISNQLNSYYKNIIRSQNAIDFFFILEINQRTTGKVLLLLIQTLGAEMLIYKEDWIIREMTLRFLLLCHYQISLIYLYFQKLTLMKMTTDVLLHHHHLNLCRFSLRNNQLYLLLGNDQMTAEATADKQVFEKNVSKYIPKIFPTAEDILSKIKEKFLRLG